MDRARYQKIKAVFLEACDRPPAERARFLDEACAGDDDLRAAVEAQLASDADPLIAADAQGARAKLEDLLESSSEDGPKMRDPVDAIGGFRIVGEIGHGGMGVVYRAEQAKPRREVALKVIRPDMTSRQLLRRFEREAEVLGQLQHPGIAQIYEAGIEVTPRDGGRTVERPYFAMELVRGEPLDRYATRHPLGTRGRLELVARVCDAVHHAHERGVLHRDLKPANILVDDAGQPKILDFGVARAIDADVRTATLQTEVGQLVGTLPYMSPEQVTGRSGNLDARSDVYALGVILYELLAGRPPHDLRGCTIPEATLIIREADPSRLGSLQSMYRGDVETIVDKALEKAQDRRYSSALDLAADIRRYLRHDPIAARPPSTWYQMRKFARRHTGIAAGLALTIVVLLAGSVTTTMFALRAHRNERAAAHETYRAKLAAAAAALALGDAATARSALETAPPEYAGWERDHLIARLAPYVAEFTGAAAPVEGDICFTPDGARLAAALRDGTVAVWDVESGEQIASLAAGRALVTLARNIPGHHVAAGAVDGTILVWDLRSGALTTSYAAHAGPVRSLAWDASGSRLASVGGTTVHLWSEDASAPLVRDDAIHSLDSVDITPQGDRVAVIFTTKAHRAGLNVFEASTGELTGGVDSLESATSCSFLADGARLAVGTFERNVSVHDVRTMDLIVSLPAHSSPVTSLRPLGREPGFVSSGEDGTIRVSSMEPPSSRTVATSPGAVVSVAVDPTDRYVATLDEDAASVRLWEREQGSALVLEGHGSYVYWACFSPDGTLAASASWDATARLWDTLTGEPVAMLRSDSPLDIVAFDRSGRRVIAGNPRTAWLWSVDTGEVLETAPTKRWTAMPALGVAWLDDTRGFRFHPAGVFTPDGRLCVAAAPLLGGGPGGLVVAAPTGDRRLELDPAGPGMWGVAVSPDGALAATASDDGLIRVWNLERRRLVTTMEGHASDVYSVDFSPDGTRLASGGNDNTVRIWDATTWDEVLVLRGHDQYVKAVAFGPDGTQLISASGDGTVRIWDSATRAERQRQARAARQRRAEVRADVEGLLDELHDPAAVADRIRADPDVERRQAKTRVLLELCQRRGS